MEAPIFRGAPVNQQERNQLNKLGGQILRDAGLDFEEWKDYHWILNETKDQGYADFYLVKRWNDSKKINEADVTVYQRLIDIDTILGTKLGTQLFRCLSSTTRLEIIKVQYSVQNKDLKLF